MFDYLFQALHVLSDWSLIAAIFLGVVLGVFFGAIPGVATPLTVAMVFPLTFTMEPLTGILLLIGCYKGGCYGGAISAILVGVPGTPAASCTVADGFTLRQQGQGGKALDIALYASVIADFVSNFFLILFASILAGVALVFGPPELTLLITFSIVVIVIFSSEPFLTLASVSIGMLLATVGMDPVYGVERFTYGNYEAMSGVSFISVLLGLFVLPPAIFYLCVPTSKVKLDSNTLERCRWRDIKQCSSSIGRGSIIGVILGVIPGLGPLPAAFMSYNASKRFSEESELYGRGSIEGIAASESGSSGVTGAAMVPLLAFGIPGDVITAIVLGAFIVHGIQPGPLLYEQQPVLVNSLFLTIMLSSLFLLIVGKVASRFFYKITSISGRVLYPIVIVLSVYGCYAINGSMFDVVMLFFMGGVGCVMSLMGLPIAPCLVGFILGSILESSVVKSLLISQGQWNIFWQSDLSLVIFIGVVLLPVIKGGFILTQYAQKKRSM